MTPSQGPIASALPCTVTPCFLEPSVHCHSFWGDRPSQPLSLCQPYALPLSEALSLQTQHHVFSMASNTAQSRHSLGWGGRLSSCPWRPRPSRSGAELLATVGWVAICILTPAIKACSLVGPAKGAQVEVGSLGPGCEGLSHMGCSNPGRAEPVSRQSLGTACHMYLAPAYVHCIHCGQGLISGLASIRPAGFSWDLSSRPYSLLWLV